MTTALSAGKNSGLSEHIGAKDAKANSSIQQRQFKMPIFFSTDRGLLSPWDITQGLTVPQGFADSIVAAG